jgi:hypothetical protein
MEPAIDYGPTRKDSPRKLSWLQPLTSRFERPTWQTTTAVVLLALFLWRFWHMRTAGNWDFMVYYWAAKAQSQGLDPYNLAHLTKVAGSKVALRFLYPPTVLYLLRPLTKLPPISAIAIYIALKVACVAGLMLIWRACLRTRDSLVLLLLVIFGFASAVFNDVFTGNVAIFEAFFLWLAFYSYLKGRNILFAAFVVCASAAKLTPLIFLPLALLGAGRRKFLALAVGAVAGAALPIVAFGGSFTRLLQYLRLVGAVDERGPTNSAILPLLKDIHEHLVKKGAWLAHVSPTAVHWGICIVVVVVTVLAMRRTMRTSPSSRNIHLERVVAAIIVYALVLPRFKDYSYCLLLPAVVFVGRRIKNALPLLILLTSLTNRNTLARYGLDELPLADLVSRYFNLVIVCVLWLGFIKYRLSAPQERASSLHPVKSA